MPDGVLINGKGPYRYNTTLVPDGIDHETINVNPGNCLFLYNFHICCSMIIMWQITTKLKVQSTQNLVLIE